MAIIQPGIPAIVPVPAGFRLQFGAPINGSASVVLPGRTLQETLSDGESLGPYQSAAAVTITSASGGTCYTIRRDGSNAILQFAHLGQTPFLPGATAFIGDNADGPSTLAVWSGARYAPISSDLTARRVSQGSLLCDWGAAGVLSAAGSSGTGAAFALDTSTQLFGKPTVKATLQAVAGQTFIGSWTPTNPISAANIRTIQVPIKFASFLAIDWTNSKLWILTSDGKSIRLLLEGLPSGFQPGVWSTLSFSRGAATVTENPMSILDTPGVTITEIRLVMPTTANASASNVWLGEIGADVKASPGSVTIRMDGEKISQYTLAFPELKATALPVSLALTIDEIGSNSLFMSWPQIKEMADTLLGDCPLHTKDSSKQGGYVDPAAWPTAAAISADRRAGSAAIKAQGIARGDGIGVWGYSETFVAGVSAARQQLVRDGLVGGGTWAMAKSTPYDGDVGGMTMPKNREPIDPLVLYGTCQVTNTTTEAQLLAIIDAAETRGESAIVTFHHFVDDSATPGPLEVRIGVARSFFQALAARRAAGGIIVQTLSDLASSMSINRQFQ